MTSTQLNPFQRHGRSRHFSASALALCALQIQVTKSGAFLVSTPSLIPKSKRHVFPQVPSDGRKTVAFMSEILNSGNAEAKNDLPTLSGSLAGSDCLEFILQQHKPLGCSVEESLASEADGSKYVFVAEVKEDGIAQKAGIEVGDVIVQLSGTFDEVLNVAGLGLDKIRSLVAGRPDESPLIVRVARGSDVKERHELALVELCIVGDDDSAAKSITAIYNSDDDIFEGDIIECRDAETDCLLDSIWECWSDGLPIQENDQDENKDAKKVKKKVAPWSSRSSPSGTYIRDPKTGKMVNIDE